ncbi:MAG: (Fe-S)-binding protein [Candidatus Lokiarchaeota archaeon]|nr:(Fe-S)-binding protein [Candidatus Lokiarchaeota archaeon]
MNRITELEKLKKEKIGKTDSNLYIGKIYEPDLVNLLKKCYQCARCSGVCQISKVQKFTPSRIIQMILEGFEDEIINSQVLWDCLMCNSCLQHCPKDINFADIVRIARYKMRLNDIQNPDRSIAHKGIYPLMSELMVQDNINIERPLDWIPKGCNVSNKGEILYYVGCLPLFNYEFEGSTSIAESTLKIICQLERDPVVVLKNETCCGHDLYWGQAKFEAFIELGKKNLSNFEDAGIKTIITACAECYRTFKIDYPNIFEEFNNKFEVKHIIEYIFDKWKQGEVQFKNPNESNDVIPFTYHDPCRLSRFLPKENKVIENVREIFKHLKTIGYDFKEMEHNKENSYCCGVNSWMNCNEKSKALRYKRLLEAKAVGTKMITSCPKCRMHLRCLKKDYEDFSSIDIIDFSEFLVDMIEVVNSNEPKGEK